MVLGAGNKLPAGFEQKIAAAGGTVEYTIPQVGIAVVTSSDPAFANAQIPGVSGVVFNPVVQMIEPGQNVAVEFGNPPFSGDDDFFFDLQWGHDAVNAPEAWDAGNRGAGVRVAVLDGGFDLDHPDLAPNINLGLSMDFTGEGLQYGLPDPFSHGSHTAGTIGAADNAFGTIGIAPEVELVLLKVLFDFGSGYFSDVIAGIVYAADVDADVINMSLGAYFPIDGREAAGLMVAISRATTYAYQMGTTVFASAGNDSADGDHDANFVHLPSAAPHVISISATAPIGWATDPGNIFLSNLASYSNYGQSVIDFAAPGGDYVYPGNELCEIAGIERPCWVFDFVFSTGNNGWYWSVGTSMASPHAAGVAALIIGANGGDMKPAHVIAEMRALSADLGKPGNDDAYGAGLVQAPQ
jgi:subtilisin family serine protease